MRLGLSLALGNLLNSTAQAAPPAFSPNIYTRSGDTILDRANSIIERRTV